MALILFAAGLLLLIVGAEVLVRGAASLAAAVGLSPLVIGLTVVAFGTSSPELAVGIKAALADQASLATGNVIGSNIFNVLFILGLSALILPLFVSEQLLRFDVPLMVALSLAVFVLALDQRFSRVDGLVLFSALICYIGFLIFQGLRDGAAASATAEEPAAVGDGAGGLLRSVVFVVAGFALLVLGSRWLVDGAVAFAQYLGVSELVIGLTIVAVGTSLPEVVTSVIAALRGQRDIAVGNVVGSNIFNLLCVIGVTSMVAPEGIALSAGVIRFDMPVMIAVAIACLPIFFTGGVISRKEGALLFAYYIAYTVFLVMTATDHRAIEEYSAALLYFVLPLTAITLLVVAAGELRGEDPPRSGG